MKAQGHLATESFAVGKATADLREAAPDFDVVHPFTVSALGAAQALANLNGDIDAKEYVRSISADPRQAIALIVSLLKLVYSRHS